jgi:hypothetical protein
MYLSFSVSLLQVRRANERVNSLESLTCDTCNRLFFTKTAMDEVFGR